MKALVPVAMFLFALFNTFHLFPLFIEQYYDAKRLLKVRIQYLKNNLITRNFIICCIITSLFFWIAPFSIPIAIIIFCTLSVLKSMFEFKKFVITRRNLTLFCTIVVFLVFFNVLLFFNFKIYFAITLLILFSFKSFILITFNYLLFPFEYLIRLNYILKAKKRIKACPHLKIIGITGSYGKTSFKNYLFTLLSEKYSVLKTPGSINTKMGICKFINESLSPYDDYFIVEYGVDKLKGMDKLLSLIKPDISIITSIGNMHLSTFKNISNIKVEKLKLAHASTSKIVFYDYTNTHLSKDDFICLHSIPYGVSQIDEQSIDATGTTFIFQNETYKVKLFGKHHLTNLIGAIKVCEYLGLTKQEIKKGIFKITPPLHRLSIEKRKNILVLDDSYNSNFEGMKEAIRILNSFAGQKAIITPGIIEQGEEYYQTNFEIGKLLINLDKIYLVNEKNHPIYKGYLDNGGNPSKIHVMTSFLEAYKHMLKSKIDIVLIANDAKKIHLK